MTNQKPLIPPSFVNVDSGPTYDDDLPDPLFRTYVRLRGLAWQLKYQQTPPLTIEELAEICHHKVRAMWGHLTKLRGKGLVTWQAVGYGRLVFNLQPGVRHPPPENLLQSFAVEGGDLLQNFAVEEESLLQNFAVTERVQLVLDALQGFGVDPAVPMARNVAALDHVTPEIVHAWGEYLNILPGVRNLAGLLLYKLQSTSGPPSTNERRGGVRVASGNGSDLNEGQVVSVDLLRYTGFSLQDARKLVVRLDVPDTVGYIVALISYTRTERSIRDLLAFVRSRIEQGWDVPEGVRIDTRVRVFVTRRTAALKEFPEPLLNVGDWLDAIEASRPKVTQPVGENRVMSREQKLWGMVLGELELQMTQATFDTWLRDSRLLDCENGIYTIAVKNGYAKDWLESRLLTTIKRTLARSVETEITDVRFVVAE